MLIWLILLLSPFSILAQEPFYAHKNPTEPFLNRVRFEDYKGVLANEKSDIDANEIIAPLMSPFMDMFDMMQQNAKARVYAEKVKKERDQSPFSNSKSIFEMIEKLQQPPTTTTPQAPLIERLLRPYIEPWQRQFDSLSKDMTGITLIPTSTTTTLAPTTKKQVRPFSRLTLLTVPIQSILEKSLAVFFPSLRRTTTTPAPTTSAKLFDSDLLERLLFSRDKRSVRSKRDPFVLTTPLPPPIFPDWEKPILELANPFTPNPLLSMFTVKPLPEIKLPKDEKLNILQPTPLPIIEPKFKLQDPFYNPLFPKKKSKLFDLLAGGEAVRFLG